MEKCDPKLKKVTAKSAEAVADAEAQATQVIALLRKQQ